MGDVLMVRVLGALQLPGADVAEHDAEREEAERAHHQQDVQDPLRLRPLLQGMMGAGVLRLRGAVEAVLQESEQEGLQLAAVGVDHVCRVVDQDSAAGTKITWF